VQGIWVKKTIGADIRRLDGKKEKKRKKKGGWKKTNPGKPERVTICI